ncbi:UPF0182 family protein [Actinomycetospora termitidis]|uniref:UPF0182 protein QRT03_14835 n=1 Tax=Actinomycetospora termitidis TaxID=3053470 RepID=A0ABT7M979_9PSEU|nr:UPF0182 family protein [Actinomycetospora sp. Odt1-22]MDL5157239.1 UPF0182 family protein [Actinomycetospora sp. Odt1-22]
MANRPATGNPQLSRRTKSLLVLGAIVLVVLVALFRLVDIYVDFAWFGEVGFRNVFTTVLATRVIQAVVAAVFMGGLLALNLYIAYRTRPVFVPVAGPEDPVARYRTVVLSHLRLFAIGIPLLVAVIAALSAQSDWQTTQLFLHQTPFGVVDPVFSHDIGFYVFALPFWRAVLSWLFVGIGVSFVAALVAHYVFGGIRLAGRNGSLATAARAHLAVLAGVFVLLKAVAYFLDRYDLLFSDRKASIGGANFFGASYTDLNAAMPAKLILLLIAVICAAAFFAAVFLRNLQIPAIALALLVLSSVLVGAAWPAVLEQFSVRPNANQREAVSIDRNIQATRQAFGLTNVNIEPYAGVTDQNAAGVQQTVSTDQATVPNIRLLDPNRLSRTFTQLEQRRNFYGFPATLDVDRYSVNNQLQDYVVAAREIDPDNLVGNQQDWINRHLVYTHGNGFVAAPANTVNAPLDTNGGQGGYPQFQVSDVDTPGPFGLQQPRIYYGELVNGPDDYAIVGADPGAAPREYDTDSRQYTYTGTGGVPLSNPLSRLAFFTYYGFERNILFNSSIGENSRIMYNRDPITRVQKVAPWLELDSDVYPAVVNGQIKYIVDGYTTLPRYPYAQQVPLSDATRDSVGQAQLAPQTAGYMRNSVKATVDAYTGKVDLYENDPQDPVLQTWEKVFPGVVQPASAVPPELREHYRYPEGIFKVQRDLLTRYHVSDPNEFYSTVSFWDVPSDPTSDAAAAAGDPQPPYYLLADDPRRGVVNTPQFQLTTALVSLRREFLSAYLSVSSDPGSYGQMTLLQLPTDTQTQGPQQVQTQFLSSPQVSTELNLLRQQGTQVLYGNLLTLPIAGGLLYVEPVYIERSNQESSFPQLSRVLVSFGGRIGYAPTLAEALTQVFGSAGTATATPGGAGQPQQPATGQTPATGQAPAAGAPAAGASAQVISSVNAMNAALDRLRTAQQQGDFAGIGQAQQDLATAINQYRAATGGTPG